MSKDDDIPCEGADVNDPLPRGDDGRDVCEDEVFDPWTGARNGIPPDEPDALARVIEVDTLMASFAAQRLVRVEALHREALAEIVGRGGLRSIVERSLRLEVATALRVSEHVAERMITLGDALVNEYPQMLDALTAARVSEQHAQVLVDELAPAEREQRDQLVDQAVRLAEILPVHAFRRELRRTVEVARAATLAQRHEEALAQRRMFVEPAEDGMAWLHLFLPAVEAHAIHSRCTAMAKALVRENGTDSDVGSGLGSGQGEGARSDERTLDQRRVDVMADLLVEGQAPCHPDSVRGIRATVCVTVPVLALLDSPRPGAVEPAMVEGVGPIPLERARELCGATTGWTRILTDPETGMVLSVGRRSYKPPDALARLVRWRADRCMAPGCGMPAARCELDHTIAWEDGGPTSLDNLAPQCKGHHTVKHHGGWTVTQIADSGGALQWTSPTGRSYRVEPVRKVLTFRPDPAPMPPPPF